MTTDAQKALITRRKAGGLRWLIRVGTILSFAALVALAAAGLAGTFWSLPYGTPPFPKHVTLRAGMALGDIAKLLERRQLVRSALAFTILAVLHGRQHDLRAGEYRFEGPLSAEEILDRLTRGAVMLHQVTFPEGWTISQIAERLAADGLIDKERFLLRARDPAYVKALLGFQAPSLEGFLFPETYRLPLGWSEDQILRVMVDRFFQVFDARLRARAEAMGWSILGVVTLASLVEKETAIEEERPLIAGVFHRRLKLGMRLESDPSVIYGLRDFHGNLRRAHLEDDHPYNTYRISGLPPGPICNPGLASLKAALFPVDEKYLYFVSKNDGSHLFSRSYREHRKAVDRYQKKGR